MTARRKSALITGASVGIGRELARTFARNGFDLVLVSRTRDALEAVAGQLEGEFGVRATVYVSDLSREDSCRELLDATINDGLAIDVLVNNAGIGFGGEFAEGDVDRQLEIIRINVNALTHLTGLFLPQMIKRRYGRILNVASTAAFQPGPLMAVYYATKAYVLSFSQALAEELRNDGVSVTALCPGPTESEFAARAGIQEMRFAGLSAPADAAEVADYGFRATMAGKRIAIPGLQNKLIAQSNRIAPRLLVTKLARFLQERR